MHHATKTLATSCDLAGADLSSVAGVERAMDRAQAAGRRTLFAQLCELRRLMLSRVAAPPPASPLARRMARVSAACRALAGEADRARVGAVLAGAQRPHTAKPKIACGWCGKNALANFCETDACTCPC